MHHACAQVPKILRELNSLKIHGYQGMAESEGYPSNSVFDTLAEWNEEIERLGGIPAQDDIPQPTGRGVKCPMP